MQFTYVNTTTTGTTPATVLVATGPVVVRKILVGNPVNSGNITLFSEGNALSNNTTQIAFKNTYTSAVSESSKKDFDFRASSSQGGSTETDGIFCQNGASIAIDQTMQVTVFWDVSEG